MARPSKTGVDYFPMDVDDDDKIELLEAKHGLEGYAILVKLWKKIYKDGYYIEWNEDIEMLFARKVNSSINLVNSVVNECLRRNLFNKDIFDKHNILTSTGIQERYFKICKDAKRKNVKTKNDYLVINLVNYGITTEETELTPEETTVNSVESTQSKEEKSKEEETKEDNKINYKEILETYHSICISYPKLRGLSEKRKGHINARVSEHGIDSIKEVFEIMEFNEFMKGKNDRNWKADFDWIMKPDNYLKAIEGKYRESKEAPKKSKSKPIPREDESWVQEILAGKMP